MKNKKLLAVVLPFASLIAYLTLTSYSGGSGIAVSGCGGGCHGTAATTATMISLSGLPAGGYVNGSTYTLTLSVNNPSVTPIGGFGLRDGFIMTSSAGAFTAIPGTVSSPATQIRHNTPKAAPGGLCAWTFNWQAPATGSATITFNAACNATNGNGSAGAEDKWNTYSTTLIKAPALAVTANATSISCNGGVSTITANASNGTAPYQFKLNSGSFQSSTLFFNNLAGTYTVTVSDAALVTASTVITITQPSLITFNTPSVIPPPCNGGLGSASVTASGGTGASKTYSISPGTQSNTTGNFSNLAAGAYTVTAMDANNCTQTIALVVTAPPQLVFNSPSITHSVCNGGTGSVAITANGGTGTKTYTINPLGPQSNSTGNFSALTAQTYTITVTDINLCNTTTTITVTQPAALNVTSSNVGGCQGSPITLSGSPAGGTFSVSNPYTGPSTTYTYTYVDGNGCSATSSPSNITVTAVTGANIVLPASGSVCQILSPSGSTKFSNASCQLITSLNATGLGSTEACVNFLPGTPSWNGEPYANRVYSITPTTQPSGSVNVCLYYTSTDIAAASIASNADVGITKVGGNGVLGGPGSVTEILNSTMTLTPYPGGALEVCFPVTSFSSFYLHSVNPNNIPLPTVLKEFYVKQGEHTDQLYWSTEDELNNLFFSVQHSNDGINYHDVGKVQSKTNGQQSKQVLQYTFNYTSPEEGYNFYRLEQTDVDGNKTLSQPVSVYRKINEYNIAVYPNPSQGDFSISAFQPVSCSIYDMKGELVFSKSDFSAANVRLTQSGLYIIKFTFGDGIQRVKKLVVE